MSLGSEKPQAQCGSRPHGPKAFGSCCRGFPEEVCGVKRLALEGVTHCTPHLPICHFMDRPRVTQALEE